MEGERLLPARGERGRLQQPGHREKWAEKETEQESGQSCCAWVCRACPACPAPGRWAEGVSGKGASLRRHAFF